MRKITEKILPLPQLTKTLADLRKRGKKIVLCHGVFDLMHPGHILYFRAARKQGDVLVVTVTPDVHINKGPGRPVFNERLRLESIASLESVDYVALNEWPTAVQTIGQLKPHFYVKGQDYANAASDLTGQIKNEMAAIKKVGGKTVFTNEEVFSSSNLINKFFSPHSSVTDEYLRSFRSRYSAESVIKILQGMSKLKVLVIGEAIWDQYLYCHPMAKSPKETIVASRFLSEENFAGGALAIANHLAGFCGGVSLATFVGNDKDALRSFKSKLHKKIELHGVSDGNRPTIKKCRFVEPNFMSKMYEIQYLDSSPLSSEAEEKTLSLLLPMFPKHDLVILADYGHGFITERLGNEISSLAKFLCVNVQTNSANYGFNVVTKYRNVHFSAVDEPEMKLALRSNYGDVPKMAIQLRRDIAAKQLLVSRGPRGSVVVPENDEVVETPAFSSRIVDRTGAGDALFALTSLCAHQGVSPEITGFVGSCVGAMAVEIVCNREPINPVSLYKFIRALLT